MLLRPSYHSSEYQHGRAPGGRSAVGPELSVDRDEEGFHVEINLDPLPCETFDDRDVTRYLTTDEARELAAMLWHHADELDRRHR